MGCIASRHQEVITLRGANQATVKDLGQLKTQRLDRMMM